MKYSMSYWTFGKEDLGEGFKRLKKFGYDGIELTGEPELYKTSEVKRLIDNYDIGVTSICGMYPSSNDLSHPDTNVRKEAIDYHRVNIDFAKELSAPLFVVTPNPVGKTKPIASLKEEWKWAVESVREIGKYAEEKGILLAIEPVNRYLTYLIKTVDRALDFVAEVNVNSVKIMADTVHMNIGEHSLGGAIRKAGTNLIHFHVADSNRQSIGRGHINFREIMEALKETNYKGSLCVEIYPPVADPDSALTEKAPKELLNDSARECINLLKFYERVA